MKTEKEVTVAWVTIVLGQLLLFSTGNNTQYIWLIMGLHRFYKYNTHEIITINVPQCDWNHVNVAFYSF